MIWTWDVQTEPSIPVVEIHRLAAAWSFEIVLARAFSYGTLSAPGRMIVGSAFPYLATVQDGTPIVIERNSIEGFLRHIGATRPLVLLAQLRDGGRIVLGTSNTARHVVLAIDSGFLAAFLPMRGYDLPRVELCRDVQLLVDSGFAVGEPYGLFPTEDDRLLAKLADGTRFVTSRHHLVCHLELMGQEVPDDLRAVPDGCDAF